MQNVVTASPPIVIEQALIGCNVFVHLYVDKPRCVSTKYNMQVSEISEIMTKFNADMKTSQQNILYIRDNALSHQDRLPKHRSIKTTVKCIRIPSK